MNYNVLFHNKNYLPIFKVRKSFSQHRIFDSKYEKVTWFIIAYNYILMTFMPKRLKFKHHLLWKWWFFFLFCKDRLLGLLSHCWHQNCTTKLLVKYSNYSNILCFMNIMPTYFKQLKQMKFYSLLNKYYVGIDSFSFFQVLFPQCSSVILYLHGFWLLSCLTGHEWPTENRCIYARFLLTLPIWRP